MSAKKIAKLFSNRTLMTQILRIVTDINIALIRHKRQIRVPFYNYCTRKPIFIAIFAP